ncbi:MAG: ParB/RepB/Spo0J family partition protein [Planctomycetaceae bacterium]|nr:ParB/RepB/Spo0J family partition protein [Planctomycetaceae bacterium]
MSKEKRLGRGLEALLGKVAAQSLGDSYSETVTTLDSEAASATGMAPDTVPDFVTPLPQQGIDVLLIDKNPYQPRLEFDPNEIQALADSIQTHGLLQPIVVRRHGDHYQLIAGERRLRAALKAGWREVPAHVLDVDDRQMAELALTENLQRRDLNAIEKAAAFQRYLEIYGGTHEELAKRLELDRSTVTNLLRLLDLPEEVREMLQKGEITQGHAKAILPLEHWEQIDICLQIRDEEWSVRQTEQYVRDLMETGKSEKDWGIVGNAPPKPKSPKERDDQTLALEQEFRTTLGSKVKLTHNNNGKGKLVVPFASHEEFERIYQMICHPKKQQRVRETG